MKTALKGSECWKQLYLRWALAPRFLEMVLCGIIGWTVAKTACGSTPTVEVGSFFGLLAVNFMFLLVDYGRLQKEIENQLKLAKLEVVPSFVGKIIQLLETQLVRHGVMVVGNSFIGKSTKIQILAKALSKLRQDRVEPRG
eukprot:g18580.t1